MVGFEYLNNWVFPITQIYTLVLGLAVFFSLLGFGNYILKKFRYNFPEPWLSIVSLVLGVLLFSLIVQIFSMLEVANKWLLISLLFFILPFGLNLLSKISDIRNTIPSFKGYAILPFLIIIIAILINLLVALSPTTKIDEMVYHMLLPARIVSDGSLIYYSLPWESAILPHMFYQIMATPLYALGLPDSANVISLSILVLLIWFALKLVWQETNNITLAWWVGALIPVGMYSVVSFITVAGNSFMVLSTVTGSISVLTRNTLLKDMHLSEWVIMCSILILGIASSKASLIPLAIMLLLVLLFKVFKERKKLLSRIKIISLLISPWVIIYFPIIIWTFINSGSPFGPLFLDFFSGGTIIFDPLVESLNRKIGSRPHFKEITFITLISWSPLLWISLGSILFVDKLSLKDRVLFVSFFIFQLIVIVFSLPYLARHFGGLQYVFIIIIAIFYSPLKIFKNNLKIIIIMVSLTLPWLTVQAYYAKPFIEMSLGIYPKNIFFSKYIPFYKDYKQLDKILPFNANILVVGSRVNSFYSPRPMFMSINDLNTINYPSYLFVVGQNIDVSSLDLNIGNVVYKNTRAIQFTFRTPHLNLPLIKSLTTTGLGFSKSSRKPKINHLTVYEIIK